MNISRRFFLGGVIAVAAGQLVKPAFAMPMIFGDGIHDDTRGLNALLAGEPFHVENEGVIVHEGNILGGTFKITDTLYLRDNVIISGSGFLVPEWKSDRPIFDGQGRDCLIKDCMFSTFAYVPDLHNNFGFGT